MYNFDEFVIECKDLNRDEIYLKVCKELDRVESAKTSKSKDRINYFKSISYHSKLTNLSGILFNSKVISKDDPNIKEYMPILLKINDDYIRNFLKNNF